MKTSNRILLALLVIIFTVPLLLAFSLKGKIKNGRFVIKKYDNIATPVAIRSGAVAAAKNIKITAPDPALLTCHLRISDQTGYRYTKASSDDSVAVYNTNDTLFITYIQSPGANAADEGQEINVNLPAFTTLTADGAIIIIDSMPASLNNLSITLKNNAEIKDGSDHSQKTTDEVPAAKTTYDQPSQPVAIKKLTPEKYRFNATEVIVPTQVSTPRFDVASILIERFL